MISKAVLLKGEETEENINFPVVRNMFIYIPYLIFNFNKTLICALLIHCLFAVVTL